MGAIAIAPTQPHGLLFNPMPNMPVVLFFLLLVGYLAYLLLALRRQVIRARAETAAVASVPFTAGESKASQSAPGLEVGTIATTLTNETRSNTP
jgi:hypothetical protein